MPEKNVYNKLLINKTSFRLYPSHVQITIKIDFASHIPLSHLLKNTMSSALKNTKSVILKKIKYHLLKNTKSRILKNTILYIKIEV